jgi:hypothetical protein
MLIQPEALKKPIQSGDGNWRAPADVDIDGLERDLRRNVEGEVRFDPGSKAIYAVDASNYRPPPIGVVVPKSKEDVVQTVQPAAGLAHPCCRAAAAPVWLDRVAMPPS